MAANFGATSLSEIHHEGLDELLHDLANVFPVNTEHESQRLGVPVLDALLEVFMLRAHPTDHQHQQMRTPAQLSFLREQNRTYDEEMLFGEDDLPVLPTDQPNAFFLDSAHRTKRPDPVVEISSSFSAAGKSQLLYYLSARAILPPKYGNVPVGGQDAAVVWIDADDRFDANRLRTISKDIIKQAMISFDLEVQDVERNADDDEELNAIITSALKHVHVFRPQSSSSLLATLSTLDTYLYDLSRHHSASRPLKILAIDSATAFFWQDRFRDEVSRTEEIGLSRADVEKDREMKQHFYLSDLYIELVQELKRLQGRFGCTVVFTTTVPGARQLSNTNGQHGPFGSYDRPNRPSLRPALPAPWGNFPVLRLVVHRDAIRPFPPTMTANEARADAPMRQEIVRQGKFSAWVNTWGREDWPRSVADGVDALNGGSFAFYVRETGVEIPLLGR